MYLSVDCTFGQESSGTLMWASKIGTQAAVNDWGLMQCARESRTDRHHQNEEGVIMPKYLAALTIVLAIAMVVARISLLRRRGIKAMKFGAIDKRDFLIPPFALLYFYAIVASVFDLPLIGKDGIIHSTVQSWLGVTSCFAGLFLIFWSLISFRTSFRVGIDMDRPGRLVTTGVFAHSRNPIYVAFALILFGEFLVFSTWISLIYLCAGILLFHRQVLLEEKFLNKQYGQEYRAYCERVNRYI
jgi:protein-S-isoprenylcysteine O-methyltransferase Ste14